MKKKNTKRDVINLVFSAFLIIGYIVCAFFALQLTETLSVTATAIIKVAIFTIFGLLLFYATRVGDGKPVTRFSIATLIILDIPALYIIVASLASGFPLYEQISSQPYLLVLACIALGYGIPYTFLSGFELISEDSADAVVEGGILESIDSDNEEAEKTEELKEEAVEEEAVEEEAVEETAEETVEE